MFSSLIIRFCRENSGYFEQRERVNFEINTEYAQNAE